MSDEINNAITAAQVAAQVASEAVSVAKEVATRAAETASKVAESALKTQESVLLFGQELNFIKEDIREIKALLDNKYVTKTEFKIVQSIVFGLSGLILTSFFVAIIAMVIKR